jgi:tetratricopeptide (TPR) repeat protein
MPSQGPVKKPVAEKEAVEETLSTTKKKVSTRKKTANKQREKLAAAEAQTELLPAKGEDLNEESGYEELGEGTFPPVPDRISREDTTASTEPLGLKELGSLDQEGTAQIVVEDQSSEDLDITDTDDALFRAENSLLQDERLGRARDLAREGQIGNAIELYRDILADSPRNVRARNSLGVLCDELGHPELALEQFEAAEGIDPQNVEVLINYGSALAVLARYGEAEQLLLRAVAIDPDSVAVRASVGIFNFRRGAYAAAELELRWVCEQDRESARTFYYYGETLNRLGRFDEALIALERATVLQPKNSRAFYTLGHLYDRKHMAEEASLMYRKARELQRR